MDGEMTNMRIEARTRRGRREGLDRGFLVLLLGIPSTEAAYPRPGVTEAVSVASDGTEAIVVGQPPLPGGLRLQVAGDQRGGRYAGFTSTASKPRRGRRELGVRRWPALCLGLGRVRS